MCSLRLEVEQALGLKFPIKNGEVYIRFDETMEIPLPAEKLMQGLYRNPDKVKSGFQSLHQETAGLLELLLPRRSRLREWVERLPEHPLEAEKFLKETSEQIHQKDRLISQIEKDLLHQLEESGLEDLFPVPLSAFAQVDREEPAVKLFLRPLGRFAELFHLNPEQVRYVVRLHFLILLLLIGGQDLDGQICQRKPDEEVLTMLACFFTMRRIRGESQEREHCYMEWLKSWGGLQLLKALPQENSVEKVRAALIFWRRRNGLSWDEVWGIVKSLEREEFSRDHFSGGIKEAKFYN